MANPSQMVNPSLPQDLLVEIFSRLPQKSIGKCKCLSKYWQSFLSTPQFLKLCLIHYGNIIMITPSHSLHLLLSNPLISNYAVSRKLDLPGSWNRLIGSCNGLVLLANEESELYLVNPVTCSMVKIPNFDLALEKTESTVISHGFGYDVSTNDYKIVTLSYYKGESDKFVDVFSVKKGVWKRLDNFPFKHFIPAAVSGVFTSGAIHWHVCNQWSLFPSIIATFDLANEVFYDTGCPMFLRALFKSLVVRGGHLCVVSSYYRFGGVIWTMDESGSVESWKKFTTANDNWGNWRRGELLCSVGEEEAMLTTKEEYESEESWKRFDIPENKDWPEVKPECFVGEEGVVLRAEDGGLFVYDTKEGTMKAFVVDGVPARCMEMGIGNFVDSLV